MACTVFAGFIGSVGRAFDNLLPINLLLDDEVKTRCCSADWQSHISCV